MIFCTDAGLHWLDIVGTYINDFGLTIFGLFECIAIGWLFGAKQTREFINSTSDFAIGRWWDVCIKYLTPIFLIIMIVTVAMQRFQKPYEGYPQWALVLGGWGVVILAFVIAFAGARIFRSAPQIPEADEE